MRHYKRFKRIEDIPTKDRIVFTFSILISSIAFMFWQESLSAGVYMLFIQSTLYRLLIELFFKDFNKDN